jgi:hypothetical protein
VSARVQVISGNRNATVSVNGRCTCWNPEVASLLRGTARTSPTRWIRLRSDKSLIGTHWIASKLGEREP